MLPNDMTCVRFTRKDNNDHQHIDNKSKI